MPIRDRVKELRRIKASELQRHPDNWRTHHPEQRRALAAMLQGIGFATAILAYETAAGTLRIIDGHLRADAAPDAEIPVLILDVNDEEAQQLLLTIDPLAAMAGVDQERLALLLETTPLAAGAEDLVAALQQTASLVAEALDNAEDDAEVPIPESFQVVAQCDDETTQKALYDRLTAAGYDCKLLTT